MPDVVVTTGVDNSRFKTGMAELRNFSKSTLNDIGARFAGLFATGSLIAAGRSLLAYGDQIQDLSQRFQVSAQALQQFGNAAEQNGSSIEGMAAGMAKLTIAQSKALGGSKELQETFKRLGITMADLRKMSVDQLLARVGASGGSAADVVAVLGRNGLELLPTLQGIADGIIRINNAIDDHTIEVLGNLNDRLVELKRAFAATIGPPLVAIMERVQLGFHNMNLAVATFMRIFAVGPSQAMRELQQELEKPLEPAPVPRAPRELSDEESGDETGGGFGGGAGSSRDFLTERGLEGKQRQAELEQLSRNERLVELKRQQTDLQDLLNNEIAEGYGGDEKAQVIREQMAENDADIVKLNEQITTEKQKQHEAESESLRAADERIVELRLELAGHDELAAQLRIEYEFNEQILAARMEGNDALAETLAVEKQLTLQVERRAAAEKAAADFKKSQAEYRERLSTNAANAARAGISGVGSQGIGTAGATYEAAAIARGASPEEILRARARDQINLISGKNPSFTEQLRLNQIVQQAAAAQSQQVVAAGVSAQAQQLQYLGALAGGASILPGGGTVEQLLQQMLGQLQNLNQTVKPSLPGSI